MFPALIEKKEVKLKKLNLKQDLFCRIYATDPECFGNGTQAYMKAYNMESHIVARASVTRIIDKPEILAKINEYLSSEGFNDVNVDKQHLFLINQQRDLGVKMKGIEHYNKLKKRIENRLELIIPKPIMDLDDDEVIHKIDKSKARDVINTNSDVQSE